MKNVDKVIIAATAPVKVELEAGKEYVWCHCGRSASQPFCDFMAAHDRSRFG